MRLIVYGDFNCPLSYLASARVDLIRERGSAVVEWRAVERDRRIPATGRPIEGELAVATRRRVAEVRARLLPGECLPLQIPSVESNTATAVLAYASAPPYGADQLRRRLFAAIWSSGRNLSRADEVRRVAGTPAATASERVASWRRSWRGLDRPAVPLLLLHTGYVARDFVALACLGRLAFQGSLPYRPWAEFRADILSGTRLEDLGGTTTTSTRGGERCPQDLGTYRPPAPGTDFSSPKSPSRRSTTT